MYNPCDGASAAGCLDETQGPVQHVDLLYFGGYRPTIKYFAEHQI
jgi:hypothetical protein